MRAEASEADRPCVGEDASFWAVSWADKSEYVAVIDYAGTCQQHIRSACGSACHHRRMTYRGRRAAPMRLWRLQHWRRGARGLGGGIGGIEQGQRGSRRFCHIGMARRRLLRRGPTWPVGRPVLSVARRAGVRGYRIEAGSNESTLKGWQRGTGACGGGCGGRRSLGGGGVEGLLVYMLDQNVKAWVLRQARAGVEAPVA